MKSYRRGKIKSSFSKKVFVSDKDKTDLREKAQDYLNRVTSRAVKKKFGLDIEFLL